MLWVARRRGINPAEPFSRRRKVRSPPFPLAAKTPFAPLLLLSPRDPLRWARAGTPTRDGKSSGHRVQSFRLLLPIRLFLPLAQLRGLLLFPLPQQGHDVCAISPATGTGKILLSQSPCGAFANTPPLCLSLDRLAHGPHTLHHVSVLHPCANSGCVELSLVLDAKTALCVEQATMDIAEL